MAISEAIESAFVFNNCPFLLCVIAQKTGVKLFFKSSIMNFVFTNEISPTNP